ncbi:hypothetical protein M9H77_13472 [Catharanthus roseus]|uniref:Uncharacterized protein n=1 Tax=Catharanthus roseus TaxID=4058 RepID=A0ACC0BKI3_CATRO|nr:hypothetical protein M9H77_13472 [Catharanthus roseus]
MEEPREDDCRVPLISSLFCLCVSAGGVLLVIYVFVPSSSKPWFPLVAFILIGSPWIFWILAYIYTCIKACIRSSRLEDRQISRRSYHARSRAIDEPNSSSNDGRKHVHFGGVEVHEGGGDSSVSSSKEIEMPFTSSV